MTDVRAALAEIDDEILLADGFDGAIVGYARRCGQPTIVVYDAQKCIDSLVERDGMTHEEAEEYFEFNVVGAWVGDRTPAFLFQLDTSEPDALDDAGAEDADVVSYTLKGTVGSPPQHVIESRTRLALQDEGTDWWHLRTKSRAARARSRAFAEWEYEELNVTGTSVTAEAAAVRWVIGGKL